MHKQDAGFDLPLPFEFEMSSGRTTTISLGFSVLLKSGTFGLIAPRSSTSARGILVYQGIIDAGFTGTLSLTITNLGKKTIKFKKGERIAQLIVLPLVPASKLYTISKKDLPQTERGKHCLGSTGR